jgi:hypothetical protein
VSDAGAWFGEGLERIGFDAGREFRERSPDETEVDRTDDGLETILIIDLLWPSILRHAGKRAFHAEA